MYRNFCNCAICENLNQASICTVCVNHRLINYNSTLKSLKALRDLLYSRLSDVLVTKEKADDQLNWRVTRNEKVTRLREKLRRSRDQLDQGKAEIETTSHDLKLKYTMLESARSVLEKQRVEQLEKAYPDLIRTLNQRHMAITSERLRIQSMVIKQLCKLFPQRRVLVHGENKERHGEKFDQVCHVSLPRRLDLYSVKPDELSVSLGYMVQLLNLTVQYLAAPALHNSGFAGSYSRIWKRDSYWDAGPSSRSKEYPVFIPRDNHCSSSGENSWSDKSSSNFGVASLESEKKPHLSSLESSSFNYTFVSPLPIQMQKNLKKGITLLKKSVACLTAYCYNSLSLDVPSEASTFEAFSKLLAILSSSKEMRSVLSHKMNSSRSSEHKHKRNKSARNANSIISSMLLESAHSQIMKTNNESNLPSYLHATEFSGAGKNDSTIDGWHLVEHPTFPPSPSQAEDIEHWTRAMITDATEQ